MTALSPGLRPARLLRPARPRERDGRLSVGRRRPADPARPSPSPHPSGFRFVRLARAGACALAAAMALLLGAATAQAHDEGATGHVHLELGTDRGCFSCAHAPTGTAEPGPGSGEITLRWQPPTTGPTGNFEKWQIYAREQSTGNVISPRGSSHNANARTYTITGLKSNVIWTVGIAMFRRTGSDSVWAGDIAQARLQSPTITADAGDDVTVRAGARVALDGTDSRTYRSGATLTYAWTQTAGPTVTLDDATSATPAFIAPSVSASTDLTFSLTVDDGTSSATDTVTVTVLPSRVVSATVDGNKLSVTFDTALDPNSRPASSAFEVTAVNSGPSRIIAGTHALVTISGSTVMATLSAAVTGDERVTVRYDKPATSPLKDTSNNALASFADQAATNANLVDETGPAFVSATANGATVTITFDEALDESRTVDGFGFQRTLDGRSAGGDAIGTGVSISGRTATVTFGSAARHGQTVEVRYRLVTNRAERVTDLSGNEAPAFPDKSVTNNTPPAFSSATVNGSALTVTFDGELDEDAVPAASVFTVKRRRSGTETTVALAATDPVSVDGKEVTLALAEAVRDTDTVTVAYAAPATGDKLQDADKLNLPVTGFGDTKTATNNTPADETGPAFVSATANGATVTITFDEALDGSGTVDGFGFQRTLDGRSAGGDAIGTGVSISGRTATVTFGSAARHGQTVEVRYRLVTNRAERVTDLLGNEAPAFPDKSVTNNTPPAFESATVNRSALTVTFDGGLDTGSVPAGSAFTVKATRGGTERDVELAGTTPVSISGSAVTLALAEAVLRIDTVTVAYAAPATGNKLQDADGENHPVPNFTAKTATNATPADETGPAFVSAEVNGATVVYTFDEPLDESVTLNPQAFSVAHGTSGASGQSASISGRTVTITVLAENAPGTARQ